MGFQPLVRPRNNAVPVMIVKLLNYYYRRRLKQADLICRTYVEAERVEGPPLIGVYV